MNSATLNFLINKVINFKPQTIDTKDNMCQQSRCNPKCKSYILLYQHRKSCFYYVFITTMRSIPKLPIPLFSRACCTTIPKSNLIKNGYIQLDQIKQTDWGGRDSVGEGVLKNLHSFSSFVLFNCVVECLYSTTVLILNTNTHYPCSSIKTPNQSKTSTINMNRNTNYYKTIG